MVNKKYLIVMIIAFLSNFPMKILGQNIKKEQPNILLIMMDDMGYSDLGFMGSKIETPNIDKLAREGVFFNQFYNAGRCCPSRASLMTGQYAHNTGLGWMTASNLGETGYSGDLNDQCITIAQALKQNDYMCYLTGKWHLTLDAYQKKEGSKHNWPLQRGFDKFYGHLSGGGSYFKTKTLVEDNRWIEENELSKNFYLTSAITEKTIGILKEHFKGENKTKPFFHYLAYYAPHRPLHALAKDISKYKDKFLMGWDVLREDKYKHLTSSGLLNGNQCKLSERDSVNPAWNSLSEKEKELWAAKMAVYAAQIDRADQGIGEILSLLEKYNKIENTLIIFLSDNGGTSDTAGGKLKYSQLHTLGTQKTRHSVRKPWSNACNTPFRLYKTKMHEGGISTPFIIHWPKKTSEKGIVTNQVGHIMDVFPTILEATKTKYPQKFKNKCINALQGKSLVSSLNGEVFEREPIFFEHQASRAMRYKNYKIVSVGTDKEPYEGKWELYDMSVDRSETKDLALQKPKLLKKLIKKWEDWAQKNHVLPLDNRLWGDKIEASIVK